jgi:hypothetical protein
MENLTLEENPPPGGPGGAQVPSLGAGLPSQQNQQLPPQMFTTAAQLLDMTDSKICDFFFALRLWFPVAEQLRVFWTSVDKPQD